MAVTNKINAMEMALYLLSKIGPISHLKLQKLLYYAQAFHIAALDSPAFDEDFEAWMHGPVVRTVWEKMRDFSILNDLLELTEAGKQLAKTAAEKLSQDQSDLIDDVLAEYGKLSAYKLECLTHSEAPWITARGNLSPDDHSCEVISKESMRTFYRNLLYSTENVPQ